MENLKVQQLIVLLALFVSLVGTLLLLEKINEQGQPVGATSAEVEMRVFEADHIQENTQETETVVHVINLNETQEI